MADISKIKLPSGTEYNIKDAEARSQIQALTGGDAVVFIGVSTTAITDGGTETPTVDGNLITPATGQLFFYGTQELIWGNDSKWHALGSLDTLGALAYKNSGTYTKVQSITVTTKTSTNKTAAVSAGEGETTYTPAGSMSGIAWTGSSTTLTGKFTPNGTVATSNKTFAVTGSTVGSGQTANYTPAGSVSTPTISVATAGSTTTIKNPTSVTVAKTVVVQEPSATSHPSNNLIYYDVTGETLSLYQLGYTTGASITTANVTVKNGDASYVSSQPSFTGTGTMLTTATIKEPTGSFTGTEGNISVSGTPNGSITNQGTFTGTGVHLETGNISVPSAYTATITPAATAVQFS